MSIVTLGVENVSRAKAFYEALGFKILAGDGDDFAMFDLEGTKLAIFPREKLAEDAGVSAEGSGFRAFSLAHNVPSKSAVEEVIAEAVSIGATVTKPAHDTFWGGYSGYFKDLDGFLWEIAWNPFTDLT